MKAKSVNVHEDKPRHFESNLLTIYDVVHLLQRSRYCRFISNLQSVAVVAFNRKMSCSLVGKGEGWQRKEKRQTDLLAKKAPLLSKAKRLRKIAAEIYTCSSRMIPLRRRRCLLPQTTPKLLGRFYTLTAILQTPHTSRR